MCALQSPLWAGEGCIMTQGRNFVYINFMINSVIYTAQQAATATVVRLFPRSASSIATMSPTMAEMTLAVAVKIAGMVMAVSTA